MKLVSIVKSTTPGRKWTATFRSPGGREKHTDFGALGYLDYTTGASLEQRNRYRARHGKDLDTDDPTRAGYLSYYLLWGSPNFAANLRAYKTRFNL